MLKIQIIVSSTRDNRKGHKVANWILDQAQKHSELQVELVDLQQWDLPMYNEPHPEVAEKFKQKIAQADGFIIVTPEYNHGYPASLKNALDYPYDEWARKVVGFVGYSKGRGSGIRSVEQLKPVMNELHLAVSPESIQIDRVNENFDEAGNLTNPKLNDLTEDFFNELIWWTEALKAAREKTTSS